MYDEKEHFKLGSNKNALLVLKNLQKNIKLKRGKRSEGRINLELVGISIHKNKEY